MREKGGAEEFCNVWSSECKPFIFASGWITNAPMLIFTQGVIQPVLSVCGR